MVEWLSSWLAGQRVRGSNPSLGTSILEMAQVCLSDLNVDRNHLLMIYNLHVKFSGH